MAPPFRSVFWPTAQIAKDTCVAGQQYRHHHQTANCENDNQKNRNLVVHFISWVWALLITATEIRRILISFINLILFYNIKIYWVFLAYERKSNVCVKEQTFFLSLFFFVKVISSIFQRSRNFMMKFYVGHTAIIRGRGQSLIRCKEILP